MASQTVADHVLARLREWGVQHVFGYPGDGINGLLAAWGRADDQPRFVQARHEEMAAFEAVGYAKFTGGRGLRGDVGARARSTCSTGCTTPSSTTCRWWRSSGRRPQRDGRVVPAGGRPADACSRTSRATTCRW